MSATGRLVFDPTDANSIEASASVGAFVRSSDGTLIDHKTIAAAEWLNTASAMFAADGTALTETGGALDVNIASGAISADMDGVYNVSTNANPDNIGIIAHSRLASPGDAQQTVRTTAGQSVDSMGNGIVHGLDTNSFLMGYDGVDSWDRLHQTNGALHVDIQDVSITTSDAALADTAISNEATAVSLVAVNAVASDLANRKYIMVANEGNKKVYFGQTGLTAATGFPLHPGERQDWRIGPSVTPQLIGGAGASSEDIRVMELS